MCTEGILAVCKKNSQFLCNDEQPTFLVGANQAWFNYATGDFGNRLYFTISMIPLQTYLTTLKAAGGNSISMLVVKFFPYVNFNVRPAPLWPPPPQKNIWLITNLKFINGWTTRNAGISYPRVLFNSVQPSVRNKFRPEKKKQKNNFTSIRTLQKQ